MIVLTYLYINSSIINEKIFYKLYRINIKFELVILTYQLLSYHSISLSYIYHS